MSIRREVLEQLGGEVEQFGMISFGREDRTKAISIHIESRKNYEEARREMLRHELARYYRVVIFGSARLDPRDPECQFVTDLAKALTITTKEVDMVTGGGNGIMGAANLGAHLAVQEASSRGIKIKSKNHGVTINLPNPEQPNGYLQFEVRHPEFSTRLQEFLDLTRAAYFAQGGWGTMLEMATVIQSKQVGHLEDDYPLLAHPFWEPVLLACNQVMYHDRVGNTQTPLIDLSDLELVHFTSSIPEIVDTFAASYQRWSTDINKYVQITPIYIQATP